VDELRWIPVPDAASRAAKLESATSTLPRTSSPTPTTAESERERAAVHRQAVHWLVAVFNRRKA